MDSHDKWFFWLAGAFFVLTAKRFGTELAIGLREPDDSADRIAAQIRWNVLVWRLLGTVSVAYGTWLALGWRAMNSALSVTGLFWLAAAIGLAWLGWQRGNRIVMLVAALMLIVAAWNVVSYLRHHQ